MKREIDGRLYDTIDATLVASQSSASTHIHRAASLYRSPEGHFFLVDEREVHGVDGALLTPLTDEMARAWLDEHGRADLSTDLFGGDDVAVTVHLHPALYRRIETAAKSVGALPADWIEAHLAAVLPGPDAS